MSDEILSPEEEWVRISGKHPMELERKAAEIPPLLQQMSVARSALEYVRDRIVIDSDVRLWSINDLRAVVLSALREIAQTTPEEKKEK